METANGNKNSVSANGHRYVFDDFEIDPANRTCVRGDEAVAMTGRVFDILLVFAENPGRLLKKDELIEKVWRGEFVEDSNLARNISTLRRALGDDAKEHKYIATVQGHGYRFLAEVAEVSAADAVEISETITPTEEIGKPAVAAGRKRPSNRWLWAIPLMVALVAAAWLVKTRLFSPTDQIKSLAVLPLKSLDAGEDYLGAGIADAVIRRISQTRQLTVRPTSAVLRYLREDADALTAARQLRTDAVLEGTLQRADDRLRVSVNLLRTGDGASLWADSFDMPAADIFAMQDKVAEQVAARLRLHLEPTQLTELNARYPTHPIAYEFYLKGIFTLDERGYGAEALPQMNATIDFFKKSLEADPNYAPAHAQLAFAYAWTALFIEPTDPKWAELARQEIKRSQEFGAQLAESHLAKGMLLWSAYEGFQNDAAIREFLLAQQLNPNSNHGELAATYQHIGLDKPASRELQRALEIDPTSQSLRDLTLILPYLRADADEYIAIRQTLVTGGLYAAPWYYLRKGRLDDAQRALDERLPKAPNDPELLMQQALLLALRGEARAAAARVPEILTPIPATDQSRHHRTYDAACIYALAGNSTEAVKRLKETAATGFPNYPLFERDPYLDHIRHAPEFVQFMAELRTRWEQDRQEFGD